jgi:broad specificity phosphatase PhoE
MNQKVLAEKETSSSDGFVWLFTEEIPNLNSDPYGVWSGNSGYFSYGGSTEEHPLLDRFCLIDQTDGRWQNLWKKISELNNEAMGMKIYKVIFFQRHGHATNNRPEADTKKKASDLPLRDAPLTQEGLIQSFNVQTMWTTENSLREGTAGIGIPQISYCSPLTRCLETHTVSFASLLGAAGGPAIITKVYEDCREIVTSSEAEHRRSADCIQEMFPKFDIKLESDEDPSWPREVLPPHDRAKEVLDRIFKEESSKKRCMDSKFF